MAWLAECLPEKHRAVGSITKGILGAKEGQKRDLKMVSDLLGLKLQRLVSHHMGAVN